MTIQASGAGSAEKMNESRPDRRRGFTIFTAALVLAATAMTSGCALHDRQAASVRALEEAAESTPEVPNVEPPKID